MHACIQYMYIQFLKLIATDSFFSFSHTECSDSNECICVKKNVLNNTNE